MELAVIIFGCIALIFYLIWFVLYFIPDKSEILFFTITGILVISLIIGLVLNCILNC